MSIPAFLCFIFALQGICLIIGRNSSKKMTTSDDYYLASKGLTFFPLLMTLIATQVGGGIILGATEEAYRYGWSIIFYPMGAALGLIVLGLGIGRKLAQFKISTIAQIFEVVYCSPTLKKIASILSITSLFMILVAQIIASNKFMISLGVSSPIVFIGFWGLVIFYTSMGGLKAVVATDVVQALFFIMVFFCAMGLIGRQMSFNEILSLGNNAEAFDLSANKFTGWLLMPLMFMVIEQDMGQRCFAAKSPKIVSKATLFAALVTLLVGLVPVFLGVLAKNRGIEAPVGGSILMTVINETTSPIFSALIGCAILAALISTADSLINAISSNFSQDFELPVLKKDLRTSQWLSALIAIVAIFFSYYFNNVVDLLIQSYELSVSCLFVPIVFAIFQGRGNSISATYAIVCGAVGFIIFRLFPTPIPREILSVLLSLAGYGLSELIQRQSNKTLDFN